jgi:hypothetical protein
MPPWRSRSLIPKSFWASVCRYQDRLFTMNFGSTFAVHTNFYWQTKRNFLFKMSSLYAVSSKGFRKWSLNWKYQFSKTKNWIKCFGFC